MVLYKKIMSLLGVMSFVILVGAVSNTAIANTPDGETPANEGVCNDLQGGSPGLYGLCVAYCEAQDLDIIGDKETPNNKILANYRKKMKAGDSDMPCLQTPCSCWTQGELDAIANPATCTTSATSGIIRSATQFASIDVSRPICRFTDRNSSISRRFQGETALSTDSAQTCLTMISKACEANGL